MFTLEKKIAQNLHLLLDPSANIYIGPLVN